MGRFFEDMEKAIDKAMNGPGYPEITFDLADQKRAVEVRDLRELVRFLDDFQVPDEVEIVTRPKGFKGRLRSIGVKGAQK